MQVSRLQTGADIGREVYDKANGELKLSEEDYILYWPDRKVNGCVLCHFLVTPVQRSFSRYGSFPRSLLVCFTWNTGQSWNTGRGKDVSS